jgi:ketosteroid isomerase-like protein
MLDAQQVQAFAADWIDAWNARDLDRILSHYADGIEFVSPFAVALLNDPSGTVRGKAALRDYFAKGLERYPDLKFELHRTLTGVGCVTLYYRSVRDLMAAETFEFDGHGHDARVLATYSP